MYCWISICSTDVEFKLLAPVNDQDPWTQSLVEIVFFGTPGLEHGVGLPLVVVVSVIAAAESAFVGIST